MKARLDALQLVPEAYKALERGGALGKIVLSMTG